MIKLLLALLLLSFPILAQTNTEVYLFNIVPEYGGLAVFNMKNISNNEGYDNQPSFIDDNHLLFAGNNNGQTDIAKYSISEKTKTWFHQPTKGSEYSPLKIRNSWKVAAVRLDPDGLQRLYHYDESTKNSKLVIEDLQIAYYAFYDENNIVASVLSDDRLDLITSDLKAKKTDTIIINSGRSIQNIPNSKSISYTALNEEKNQDVYMLDLIDRESYFVCQLPIGIQDHTWLNDSQILIGSGSKLYIYDTFLNADWKEVADLSEFGIKNISRLAVSPNAKKLALVAEPN